MTTRIVVGVDGSDASARAVRWCAEHAAALHAEVVAVHAVDFPAYAWLGPYPVTGLTPEQHDELRNELTANWCKPLADAGVAYRAVVVDGYPAAALIEIAQQEAADLIVTGRRGRNSLSEFMLGSTSHQLTHQIHRPLVIVP
jgi:nucleotide-binding universal stress UspA family protein